MASINKVLLIGRLGQDPELRTTQNGNSCALMSLATTESYKDSNGDRKEETQWHRIIAWGKLAENCNKYLAKGREIYLEGKIQYRTYEKDGEKRYATQIVASDIKFLSSKNSQDSQNSQGQSNGQSGYQKDFVQNNHATPPQNSRDAIDDIPF